jgi:N-methylhydantoinase B
VHDTDTVGRIERGERLPATLGEMGGVAEVMPQKHPRTPFTRDEVWYHHWQGGAGYGDPLDRDPAAVARDVRRHLTSPDCATRIYGVVLTTDGEADVGATTRAREAIREARRRQGEPPEAPVDARDPAPLGSGRAVTEYVEIVGAAHLARCRRCGHGLALGGADQGAGCRRRHAPLTAAGPHRGEAYDRGRFGLLLFDCPGCATQLEAEVVQAGAPRATQALFLNGHESRRDG